ncbi:MAG: NUDIX domain-containing protein [Anaerolineae bacterium]|nr:NUDIX domain-containing protein [Gemmatimonadaceae bacterium]
MVSRKEPASSRATSRLVVTVDVVILSRQSGSLSVLLCRPPRGSDRWEVPYEIARPAKSLVKSARRTIRDILGSKSAWLEQTDTFDSGRHPADSSLSVTFLALVPGESAEQPARKARWFSLDSLPSLASRHRSMVAGAAENLRARLGSAPVAFQLVPRAFTLSDLQAVYEMILEVPLHKASFRRTLDAAGIVKPLEEWRIEGRGRPAQLYRYKPRKRRGRRHGIRFDMPAT